MQLTHPEERHTIRCRDWKVVTTTTGGAVVSIQPTGYPTITRECPPTLEHGRQAGLFVCPRVFARLPDRQLRLRGDVHEMVYPEEVDAAKFDPDRLYLHGIEFLYRWERLPGANDQEVSYVLARERFPKDDPLPYTARVTYSLADDDLVIRVAMSQTRAVTGAPLAVHPFFKFHLGNPACTIQLEARLKNRFGYGQSLYPLSVGRPTPFSSGGPFVWMNKLPPDLDHSHEAESGEADIYWEGGPRIRMSDQTPDLKAHYLQIWTTSGLTGNVCGIEQGGLSNVYNLIADGHVPEDHLPLVAPGESKERIVRYSLLG